ncbi:acyl-ACP--UDP-N-acetylglucosamine O-acyltransferase [Zooshikella ganghwensis]|uniref:Acyl-[acyl-carrier-protein]--UDP-N-acetylglucosamine O-acyltransferase n=1 Tax=Zooshikella ganghwensis TaxID=202772 RepID=A0A4P9VNJ2_9GAMM|nr:acyl-ACP--UDP-N-acetylglucosamine O-acyltransferase [Zooshikella ganghwensis]RDH45018.1 acyl-ACP--UDP-N-acetylglucosamine O-acyltransferase [Zooshikella ganghwensis]
MCKEGITTLIDPRAIIDPSAKLAADVEIGPWTYVGPNVEIDSGTVVHSHVVLKGPTKIGKNNRIFQFSSVGEDCQDKKYKGEPTRLEIGDNNIIREGCTIHRGTIQDNSVTKIGNNNLLMAYVHIGHDCVLSNDIIMANNAAIAGHVYISDGVILGGYSTVHQFCQVGPFSMTAAHTAVFKDIPAFVTVSGNPAAAHGMNYEGMRRRGYSAELISVLRRCYRIIYRQGLTLKDAITELEQWSSEHEEVQCLINSLQSSNRGITR